MISIGIPLRNKGGLPLPPTHVRTLPQQISTSLPTSHLLSSSLELSVFRDVPPISDIGRKRTPLPPQSARFQMEVRPKAAPFAGDRAGPHQGQTHPPVTSSPTQPTAQLPLGPRDQQRPSNSNNVANLPSGPRYQPQAPVRGEADVQVATSGPSGRGIDRDTRRSDRRASETAYLQPSAQSENSMVVDIDSFPPRIPHSPSGRHPNNDGHPQGSSGMYADREAAISGDAPPRGPRAMSSRGPPTSELHHTASTSPTTSFVYTGRGEGRNANGSPPSHLRRANDGGRESEYYRRDDRPRMDDHQGQSGYQVCGVVAL